MSLPISDDCRWQILSFDELTLQQLYGLLKLRSDVFVVEQQCVYPDLDELDCLPDTRHALGTTSDHRLVVYGRAMAPTQSQPAVRIGRVVTVRERRGAGLARTLMNRLLDEATTRWRLHPIVLSAQIAVVPFYRSLGFDVISTEYLDDGIPHIDMQRAALR